MQGCVFLLCDPLHPSPFYALGSSSPCMGVSPALTLDFRAPGSWGTGISPSSLPLLPALPLGEGPQPGLASPQPPQVMSLGHTWACWAPWRCRPALTELLGRGGGALLAGVFCDPSSGGLLQLLGHLPFLSPLACLHPHQWAQWLRPATSWSPNSLPLDLRVWPSHPPRVPGRPRGPTPVPFPRAKVLGAELHTPLGPPPATAPACELLHITSGLRRKIF